MKHFDVFFSGELDIHSSEAWYEIAEEYRIYLTTVSYTHLTLPTIYSV